MNILYWIDIIIVVVISVILGIRLLSQYKKMKEMKRTLEMVKLECIRRGIRPYTECDAEADELAEELSG